MSITVSIVEDNDQLRTTLARVLNRSEGFECVGQHASAEAALEGLPAEKPSVVLMDINLPGINGVECVRRLKPLLPGVQVIMLLYRLRGHGEHLQRPGRRRHRVHAQAAHPRARNSWPPSATCSKAARP